MIFLSSPLLAVCGVFHFVRKLIEGDLYTLSFLDLVFCQLDAASEGKLSQSKTVRDKKRWCSDEP